jgi:cytochrome c-type biogenesis protein CcmH
MAEANFQDSPEFQLRLRSLSEELRCLVCQNQSLADSNADLAIDLRREVQRLMADGKTDVEVKAHLVARYGDFVLYKPPVQSNTALLWGGPPALLIIGAAFWRLAQRRSKAAAQNMGSPTPSQNEVAKKLLD